jgi:hypothetical protein
MWDTGLHESGHRRPGQRRLRPGADRALVFFWQQAHSFGQYLLAIFRAVVSPALLVHKGFQGLVG